MSSTFDKAINFLIGAEGGYSNDQTDRGGATNYGISQWAFNYGKQSGIIDSNTTSVADITIDEAKSIYEQAFWNDSSLNVESVNEISPELAIALFDMAVNSGVPNAVRKLQELLNLNQDGILGPDTLDALKNYDSDLVNDFLEKRQEFYDDIISNDDSQQKYEEGWKNRLNDLKEYLDNLDENFHNDSLDLEDRDNDGIPDLFDDTPDFPDRDMDGTRDDMDTDRDGDGIPNDEDDTPDMPDRDGDGIHDELDDYPDDPNNNQNNDENAPDSGNNNDDDNSPDPLNPPPPPRDPLVLDTNKDGFISTIALSDSNAYFDITGDGIKEKVSWIAPNDGILVYDKNESGKIDGIDEVFGNFTKNGFEELKELIDSNHDGKIDRQDELFNRLQIWNDTNGDGTTQTNELQSLKDAGVKSIDLNYVSTDITLGGATLTEASKYTDAQGNKELVADVNLEYNPILTTVDTSTIPDYTVDPDTLFLPQLRGYGLIMDSLISYNTNDALKEKALELQAGGIQAIAEGFEEFSEIWSGYTELIDSMKEKYNVVGDVNLAEIDKRVWILERLTNSPTQTPTIEARLEALFKAHANETLSETLTTSSVILSNQVDYYNTYYQRDFINRYEGAFALQSAFDLDGAHYSKNKSKFIVDDRALLFQEAAEYFNSNEHSLQEKTYLAQLLNMQIGRYMNYSYEYEIEWMEVTAPKGKNTTVMPSFILHVSSEQLETTLHLYPHSINAPDTNRIHSYIQQQLRQKDIQSLINSIEQSPEKSYIQTALTLDTSKFNVFDKDMLFNGEDNFILGNQTDDFITSTGNNATILAGKGDDIISTGSGKDTILYRKGDGADTIYDKGGSDTLKLVDISKDEITLHANKNDLIITLSETDSITIKEYFLPQHRIETILFQDGSTLNFAEVAQTYFMDDTDNTITLTNASETINGYDGDDTIKALGGDDTLIGGKGNDTLEGGDGNDTYIFNAGDGSDTILDSKGSDTLRFGDGITLDMLSSKMDGDNLVISLNTGDTVTIQNYTLASNKIENITLNDGSSIDITSLQAVTDEDDTLVYADNSVIIDAKAGNDHITSGSGADTIDGGEGNDTIITGAGNDILIGGKGDDILMGGLGDDTYIYNRGDGKDTIIDSYTYGYNNSISQNAGNDTIKLGAGITKDDLLVTIVGSDIVVALKEEGKTLAELSDTITIKNGTLPNNAIENILLDDGTKLLIVDMQEATEGDDTLVFGDNSVSVDALGGNDTITSGKGNDTLYGGEGNDTLRSNDGDDTLYGGEGDDTLDGGRGNDILVGGKGNDTLMGGLGNDTYIYNRGDGKDTIIDSYSYGNAGNDTLKFGEGINAEDIIAKADGNDMIIALKEDGKTFEQLSDTIILKDWLDPNKRVENFMLADGTTLTLTQMQQATDGDDYLTFGDEGVSVDALGGNDTVISGKGNDTLRGGEGNDTLIAGLGDDILEGGDGSDTLRGEEGNDILYGGAGDDLLQGGKSHDTLYGGSGTDILEGGEGNDTYVFARGDTTNTIIDTAGNDTLRFAEGINKEDILVKAVGKDIIIALAEVGKSFEELSDRVVMKNWLDTATRIENIMLSDGTALNLSDLSSATEGDDYLVFGDEGADVSLLGGNDTLISGSGDDTIDGGAGDDTITTNGGADIVYGREGNDIIDTGDGHDFIDGGEGDDTIYAGKGNDTLIGGKGNDTLIGGYGDDTYIFNIGDGFDTLFDTEGNDTLQFGEGVTKDDLLLKQNGYDLLITLKEEGKNFNELSDKVLIQNWFKGENNIETFTFADGSKLLSKDIAALFVNVNIEDTLFSKAGALMRGEQGDDVYVYNRGDFKVIIDDYATKDDIEINAGYDTLQFSSGITKDDVKIGVNGNNLIIEVIGSHDTYEQLKDYVVVKDWKNENRGIEKIVFSDGEVLEITKTETFPSVTFDNSWTSNRYYIYGSENNTIAGSAYADKIEAGGGDDTINAGAGNDTIYGDAGDDNIDGGAGNDTFIGGTGADYLRDSAGDDTYVYARGDGRDIIYDTSGNDTLRFAEGITKDDIIIKQYGNTMVVGLKEGDTSFYRLNDKITIRDWYLAGSRIETFAFSDGSTMGIDEIVSAIGTDKNDTIYGVDSRNDTLVGGKGDDTLIGGAENDTYIYNRGDGKDTVIDSAGLDTIKFGIDINAEDIVFERVDNNLVVALAEEGKSFAELKDTITVKDWYTSLANRVEFIEFFNGTKLVVADEIMNGTEEADNLTFGAEDNVINALGGNDTIYGGAGNDTISGNEGNDTLYGQDGNDILDGGTGNDTLYGGKNNDTYLFGRGDGADKIIEETAYNGGGIDTLRFKEGITADDIIIKQMRNNGSYELGVDIVIALKEEGKTFAELSDKITIQNGAYYHEYGYDYTTSGHYDYRVEKFEFADGTEWSFADIVANTNSDENDTIHGFNSADTLSGGKGNDTLKGYLGNDTYIFNRGDGHDTIYDYGRSGSNYSYHNAGDDTLKFGEGINKNDVVFYMNGNNLVIDCKNSDQVTITNQNNDNNAIETIMLSDGSYLTSIDVQRIVTDLSIYAQENNLDISSAEAIRANSELVQLFNSSWKDAQTSSTYTPPLVLDLNQNDQTSIALADSHAYFDYDGDGKREHTAWMESGDALLAVDLNGDGAITNGGELFGDFTKLQDGSFAKDGYEALAQYDSNNDNIIDKNDTRFGELLLWRDDNRDGKSTASELINVALSSITAIHLNREEGISFEAYMENGNIITNETLYEGYNNTTGTIRDVWFEYDSSDTITNNDTLVVTKVNDVLIGEDGNDTYKYKMGDGAITIDDQDMTQQGIDKLVFGAGITKEQLVIKWEKGTNHIIVGVREHIEDDTPLSQLEDKILIKDWFNATGLIETFTFTDGSVLDRDTVYDLMLNAKENGELTLRVLDENTELAGGDYNDVLYGMSGNEALEGKDGDDYLLGFEGDDLLDGGHGNDVLVGGKGDDTLIGGSGDDFYIYNKGDGRDTIIDAQGNDTLFFGEGITRKDIMFEVVGDDMKITFAYDAEIATELRDSIIITNWQQNGFEIENLEFANGEIYTIPELIEKNTNHAPTTLFAESSYILTDVNIQTGIVLARDSDGDTLNYTVATQPENGTLSINQYGIWTYQANEGYKGIDSAVVMVDDGNGLSSTKVLNFEIVVTNVAPTVAESQVEIILQDIREQTGKVEATDADGDTLNYTVSTTAQHGTLSVDLDGNWNYQADDLYIGTDSAVITVDDGNDGVATQTLAFDTKVSAPTLSSTSFALDEDTSTTGTLNVTNPIGGALTYEIVEISNNGEFTLDAEGSYSYIPSANYNGNDSVNIKVTNEYGLSTTSTFSFEIEAVNDAPILLNNDVESYTLKNIREAEGKIEAEDIDGDTLNYTVTTATTHGELNIDANGNWNYQANASFNGKDSAVISVDDGNGGSVEKTLYFQRDGYIYEGGNLLINDTSDNDTLMMDTINQSDLSFTRQANNLQVHVQDEGVVTLQNYFANTKAGVDTIQTAQGSINLSKDAIKTQSNHWFANIVVASDTRDTLLTSNKKNSFLIGDGGNDTIFGGNGNDYILAQDGNDLLVGGARNDTLFGANGNDTLYGDNGNDTLFGGNGHDSLIGGLGNDTLYGDEGDDFLSGGKGNDTLKGGLGDDTYFFSKGDGKDTIADSEPSRSFLWFNFNTQDGGNDTIKFDKDITKEDISFYMRNNDLILQYSDNDSIAIKNQNNKNAQIEKLELSDGSYLTNEDIERITQQISAYGKDKGMWHIDNKTIQANNDLMNIVSSAWQA
jgi:Ca2+-binding RTX toxin-like protein